MHLFCWRAQTLACFLERPEQSQEMVSTITPSASDWSISVISLSERLGCFHLISAEPFTRKALSFSHLGNMNDQCLNLSLASRFLFSQDGVLSIVA